MTKAERAAERAKLEAAIQERLRQNPLEFGDGPPESRRRALIWHLRQYHADQARAIQHGLAPDTAETRAERREHERLARKYRAMLRTNS